MPAPLTLPAGYSERPLTLADAAAVTAVMAAAELHDLGEVVIEESDIVADWSRPSYDVSAGTVGVVGPDGDLVAYAEVSGPDRGDMSVHPDHRARGLEEELANWMRARAAERGEPTVGFPMPAGGHLDGVLDRLGWPVRWTSWVLSFPEGVAVPERPLPDGYAVRAAARDEVEQCWTVAEDAFLEWSVRERQPFEDWAAVVTGYPGWEPWHLRVVVDPTAAVVAVAVLTLASEGTETYVDKLATRADQRGRGLAQALLADAFAAGRAHGATKCSLSTDSRTGALGLYEKLGMQVTSTWVNRAAPTR